MRGRFVLAGASAIAVAVIACNALTGASDLGVCEGAECTHPDEVPLPTDDAGNGGTDGNVVATDAGADTSLPPTCVGDEKRCSGNVAAHCVSGSFQTTTCAESCVAGDCTPFPSCRNAANPNGNTCGPDGGAGSCCETIAVPGGTYNRLNDATASATVSPFKLDKLEVTVARFRAFVEAGEGTLAKPPAAGAGAHPKIANSGWNADWNIPTKKLLPNDKAALLAALSGGTWTNTPGASELRPITQVTWFMAFAFCAWDGGRLPTNAEWGFAAGGGSEQRLYPWSNPPTSTTINSSEYAAFDCAVSPPSYNCVSYTYCSTDTAMEPCDAVACGALATPGTCTTGSRCSGCAPLPADVPFVGRYPKGVGRWGHFDLGGSASEWVLDATGNKANVVLPKPCVDCAQLVPGNPVGGPGNPDAWMIYRGGSWNVTSVTPLRNVTPSMDPYDQTSTARGIRCARD